MLIRIQFHDRHPTISYDVVLDIHKKRHLSPYRPLIDPGLHILHDIHNVDGTQPCLAQDGSRVSTCQI